MNEKPASAYCPLPLPDRVQKSDADALNDVYAFWDYMRKRHSVRDYSSRPVPEEIISAAIGAPGRQAPTISHGTLLRSLIRR